MASDPSAEDDVYSRFDLTMLFGWPWKLAAFLLMAAMIAYFLAAAPEMGVSTAFGRALPGVSPWLVAALAILAGILALLSPSIALRRIAMNVSAPPETAPEREDLVAALGALLAGERNRLREVTSTVHGILSVGVQFTEAARDAERRLRALPPQLPATEVQETLAALRATLAQMDARIGKAIDLAARAGQQPEAGRGSVDRLAGEIGTAVERMQAAASQAEQAMARVAERCEAAGSAVLGATGQLDGATGRLAATAGEADAAIAKVMDHLESVASSYAFAVEDLAKLRDSLEEVNGRNSIVIEAATARLAGKSAQESEAARRIESDTQALSAVVTMLGEEILRLRTTAERHDSIISQAVTRLAENRQE
jgi:hypothetical protein